MTMQTIPPTLYPHTRPLGMQNYFLIDGAEEHFACYAPFPETGTLKAVIWNISSVTSPVMTLRVSIETQQAVIGQIVATTDAAKTLYAANAVSDVISNPSAGVIRSAINGTTGISVTEGDLFAAVVRCLSRTSGSINIRYVQYGVSDFMAYLSNSPSSHGSYGYVSGTATYYPALPFAMEYATGIKPMIHGIAPNVSTQTSLSWNSTTNPNRRGMKFRFPNYSVRLRGAYVYCDFDSDTDVVLYGPDGYTVVAGPYTINTNIRPANALRSHWVPLNGVVCQAGKWYRLSLYPKTTTSILMYLFPYTSVGGYPALDTTLEGQNVVYTYRNGPPSAGDAAWTDNDTQRVSMQLVFDGIDIGRPEFRGCNL